jgi:D-amino-acid oxidase
MKTKQSKKILVIGAGVTGLTTAHCLATAGYQVVVVSKDFSPDITSNVAGALWEWPPAVCGYHSDQVSLKRSKDWCMTSYHKFYDLQHIADAGVFIRPVYFFFREKVNGSAFHRHKMGELETRVHGFRHDAAMIQEEGINQEIGLVDAYCHDAPMVNTDVYMEWLMKEVLKLGVEVIQGEIQNQLKFIEKELLAQYGCQYIVNCSGLGSRLLAGEYMYPLRGALVRIKNNGVKYPFLNKSYCVSFDENTRAQDIVFIVPRGENLIVLGALAEENEWDKNINLDNYQLVRDMLTRSQTFLPYLKDAELDESEPVRVGLRPFRRGNVRLDWEPNSNIIHSYGHGGAGVTFSWGCSEEVTAMIQAREAETSQIKSNSQAQVSMA